MDVERRDFAQGCATERKGIGNAVTDARWGAVKS